MYLHKTPAVARWLYPRFVWRQPTHAPVIYLTFDDGPVPGVTEWTLNTLAQYQARATFFCVGDNVRKHPAVFAQLQAGGHQLGNHTHRHRNGWRTDAPTYLADVRQCAEAMQQTSGLFRPPYGRLTRAQARALLPHYRIVMWDVLTADFDARLSPENCLKNAVRATQAGSIVLFHDSLKAETNLRYALPRFLAHFADRGFSFAPLPDGRDAAYS